jgi:hypothetical protein
VDYYSRVNRPESEVTTPALVPLLTGLNTILRNLLSVCRTASTGSARPLLPLLALVVSLHAPGGAYAAAGGAERVPARVVSDAPDRVVFRIDLDGWTVTASPALEGTDRVSVRGYGRAGEPGGPMQLARKFLVGLPPEGSWRVSWRVLESVSLGRLRLEPVPYPEAERDVELGVVPVERYEIDDDIYTAFRSPDLVTSDTDAWIRRQRVLPLWVQPLSYDPSTSETVLATSIEVTVSFSGGRVPGVDSPGAGVVPAPESTEWEEVFSRMLVNAGRARSWRLPLRTPESRPQLSPGAGIQTGPLVRLEVKQTGVHKVSADSLISAGFPSGRAVSELHLFRRGYDDDAFSGTVTDVPFEVAEKAGGTPGVFDGADLLIFYGRRLRDDASRKDPYELYSDHNVYWLGTTGGPTMTDRALQTGYISSDTSTAWFPVTRLFTDDHAFFEDTKAPQEDYYFFNDGTDVAVDFPFELETVRPGSAVSLAVKLHGATYLSPDREIEISLVNSKGTRILTPSFPLANKDTVSYRADLQPGWVDVGENTFHYTRPGNQYVRVLINWLEVSYQALYRARGNSLHFNTASLSGDTSITVTGLSDTDVWMFDVTNPDEPVNCLLTPGHFTDVGGSWALTFRDAISSRKEYVVIPENRMITIHANEIEYDKPSSIIGSPAESGVDVLVVSHGDFLEDLSGADSYDMYDWVRYRRAQGKRVLMVDVQDVYDEFNGGVPGTLGIDRFVRHFFELGNAGYVLLVGDGSEDHKRSYVQSDPDFVPSHCRTEYVGSGFNEDEVVTLDKKFVKLPNPAGTIDSYPDLVIGRFPVGSMSELQRVLFKVFKFEKPQASDFWRRRMILIADDGWGQGGTQSCWSGDTEFETSQEYCAQITEAAQPGSFDVVRFFLSDYNNKYHTIPPPYLNFCEGDMYNYRQLTRAEATVALLNELRQGATLVTIQAHMNRSLVTHEWLFVTLSTSPNGIMDHFRCNNRDRPFIIFGMGCHFSDYALFKEQARLNLNSPNGDCFAEQLLFQNNEAAASTYGSAGFEYLSQVNQFMERFSEIWFYEAPYDTMVSQTQGRWVLGPMMFLVEAEAIRRHGQSNPVDRYLILGDPLLRIDAGPPLIDVTVNGTPVQSGDDVPADTDTISVVATVKDENVIEKFELWINGEDKSGTLAVTPIGGEPITPARAYEVRFDHALQFDNYDIILQAMQAPDTTDDTFNMVAEFRLHVRNEMDVSVNGRAINNGDLVPASGNYQVTLELPTYVPSTEISVKIDDEDVAGPTFAHPTPEDSTTWIIRFSKTLSPGAHELKVSAGTVELPAFVLNVARHAGVQNVVNYPNPFTETTQFLYTTEMAIDAGTIDVFTVSGKRIVRLEIPPSARNPGQNAVFWDGRDSAGDEIANGVYLYVIRITQGGQDSNYRGKLARMK